jgi:uncharacterized protein YndB with AHSA1/START domain
MTTSKLKAAADPSNRITMERTFQAPIEDIWDLWTTKDGIESWWGPNGFTVKVHKLDLRPGGELHYDMIAVGAQEIEFMKSMGMPVAQPARLVFREIVPHRRLEYLHLADFIPGVEPYDVTHIVELHRVGDSVRMVLTFDRMHEAIWTERATQGWEMELGKLAKVVESRAA